MANTFKSLAVTLVGPSTTVYTCPASTTAVVIGMRIGNTVDQDHTVAVALVRSAEAFPVVSEHTPIPAGGALEAVQGSKLVLQAGDELHCLPSADDVLAAIVSVMEIT